MDSKQQRPNIKEYKTDAACHKGCALCCSVAGSIDITMLEGPVIQDQIKFLPRPRQVAVKKSLPTYFTCWTHLPS